MTFPWTWSTAGSRSRATRWPRSSPSGRSAATASSACRPGTRVGRIFRREGISIDGDARALRIQVHVVVAHGLNLAEVASTVRSQVAYEVERLTGLKVAAVEVVIERVRQSA